MAETGLGEQGIAHGSRLSDRSAGDGLTQPVSPTLDEDAITVDIGIAPDGVLPPLGSSCGKKGKDAAADRRCSPRSLGTFFCAASPWDLAGDFLGVWMRRPSKAHLDHFDGLRALAVAWVVAFHVMTLAVLDGVPSIVARVTTMRSTQIIFNGDLAVDLFLCISGYLAAMPLIRDFSVASKAGGGAMAHARVCGNFFLRRWLRVFPLLAAAVACTAIAQAAAERAGEHDRFGPGPHCMAFENVWPVLLFVNNYLGNGECVIQSWYVAVQFQLYLLTPPVVASTWNFARHRMRKGALAGLAMLSTLNVALNAVQVLVVQGGQEYVFLQRAGPYGSRAAFAPASYVATWCRFAPYVSGIAVALLTCQDRPMNRPWHRWLMFMLDVLACFVIAALAVLGGGANLLTYQTSPTLSLVLSLVGRWALGWSFAYLIFAWGTGRLDMIRRALSLGFFHPLSTLSYGVYLFHIIWVTFVRGIDSTRGLTPVVSVWVTWSVFTWDWIVVMTMTSCTALVAYILVEMPAIRLGPRGKRAPRP